jgi:hypothetical protein
MFRLQQGLPELPSCLRQTPSPDIPPLTYGYQWLYGYKCVDGWYGQSGYSFWRRHLAKPSDAFLEFKKYRKPRLDGMILLVIPPELVSSLIYPPNDFTPIHNPNPREKGKTPVFIHSKGRQDNKAGKFMNE